MTADDEIRVLEPTIEYEPMPYQRVKFTDKKEFRRRRMKRKKRRGWA